MSNIYSHPEKFGLTTVGEIEWSYGGYEFDLTVVWHDGTQFAWAEDSGCSCPSPFEDIGVDDLARGSFTDLAAHLSEETNAANRNHSDVEGAKATVVDLLARAQAMVP